MRLAVTAIAEHPGPYTIRLDAVRDPGRGGEIVLRLLVERDGRRILRALDERCPERTADAGNETDIRGVSRQASSAAPPTMTAPSGSEVVRSGLHQGAALLEQIAAARRWLRPCS